ncbi:MAG: hypothetical protein HC881_18885, partial [Leptolyngbyaceae cyanobacterium SL_7_1]|nr:hypothetical protein [Leptolyngbyaceae cyanobacterium SL_7_1]
NLQHDRGKHKARLFAAMLGLGNKNTELLQTLIRDAIQIYDAIPTTADQYGQRYIVDFPVTHHQATATVRTTWIIRPNETFPRLTSCYIVR